MFMHASFWHLFGNMIFLWAFGALLETVVGRARYIAYYFMGGLSATFLFTGVESVFHPHMTGVPLIGASGAISAVMGVFMVRCYFTKVKTAIGFFPLFFIPRRFKINALAIVGFYLALNVYYGFKSLDHVFSVVAYWAHLGGFIFGIAASLLSGHLNMAHVDKYRKRSGEWIEKGIGLGQARSDLEAILETRPNDGWALFDLARIEIKCGNREKGEKRYQQAISAFISHKEMDEAMTAFSEYFKTWHKVLAPTLQMRICRELIRRGEYNLAARSLEAMIRKENASPSPAAEPVLERAYITLGRLLADRLGCPGPARAGFMEFIERFPKSTSREMALQKLRLLIQTQAA
jgi:membrane associated rhomboid family serine protease